MKLIFYFFLLGTLLAAVAVSDDQKLPRDSTELLEKLSQFEETERARTESAIAEKRNQVAALLRAHLQRETKSGNLDAALELRKKIEVLSGTTTPQSQPIPSTPENKLDDNFVNWLATVTFVESSGVRFSVTAQTVTAVYLNGTTYEYPITAIDSDKREVAWKYSSNSDKVNFFKVDSSRRKAIRTKASGLEVELTVEPNKG